MQNLLQGLGQNFKTFSKGQFNRDMLVDVSLVFTDNVIEDFFDIMRRHERICNLAIWGRFSQAVEIYCFRGRQCHMTDSI